MIYTPTLMMWFPTTRTTHVIRIQVLRRSRKFLLYVLWLECFYLSLYKKLNVRPGLFRPGLQSYCHHMYITDFFNPGTPQEFDVRGPTTVIDEDFLNFDLKVETLTSSMPDPSNVINISDHVLSGPQLEILNRGLKFIPTPGEAPYWGS